MSADIISFPLKASSCLDQQRWIPAPRERRASGRSLLGWLRLTGIMLAVLSSWALVIGTARLIAIVL